MNSFTSNLSTAQMMAEQTIQDRVRDAEQRALAHAVRAERRAEQRAAQAAVREPRKLSARRPPRQPWWAFRFLHPVR
jgi:hypothetical protein